jgi:hypothetical protein
MLYSLLPVRSDTKLLVEPGETVKPVQLKNVGFCTTFCGYKVMFCVLWKACDAPQWVDDESFFMFQNQVLDKVIFVVRFIANYEMLALGIRNLISLFSSSIIRRLVARCALCGGAVTSDLLPKYRIMINDWLDLKWTGMLLAWCLRFSGTLSFIGWLPTFRDW